MGRLPLPSFKGNPLVSKVLERIASGAAGRFLTPLAPLLAALGVRDRSNNFVLNIGDEGATLVQVRGGEVVDAVFAEASAEEGWDALREMLRADPRAPIVLVADVLEQMFREDTVPKVSILDRAKLIRRRLDLTFPNDQLKAALPYARSRGASQPVLFAALPASVHLTKWLTFLDEFVNPLRGFYMLPLEVVGVAGRLAPVTQGEKRRVWRALITQEAASGFRQVFEARGKLMVTRLTQRPTQPLSPEAEAMLVERELRSSISYVKRLGFSDSDRLDVVILADPAVCRAVDERDLPATTVSAYTPYQAGVMLGLGEIGREDSPFADVLLGQWIAKKRAPTLALSSPRIAQQLKMRRITRWSAAATAVLSVLAVYYVISLATDFVASTDAISRLADQVKSAQSRLDRELDRVKNYDIPLGELTEVAETEKRLAHNELDIPELTKKIAASLGGDGRVSHLTYELKDAQVEPTGRRKPPAGGAQDKLDADALAKPIPFEIHLVVDLARDGAPALDTQTALEHAKSIQERLSAAFKGYEVEASKLPGGFLVNQVLEGSASGAAAQQHAKPSVPTAEYVIRRAA